MVIPWVGFPLRDVLALPRTPGELAAKNLGNVCLDADRTPVAVVAGTVGALLEVAHAGTIAHTDELPCPFCSRPLSRELV